MTFLDCSVTGCAYNADKCCCKGEDQSAGKRCEAQRRDLLWKLSGANGGHSRQCGEAYFQKHRCGM